MHTIEPFDNWMDLYVASEDENSPFFEKEYKENEFSNALYNYYVHPQWDDFGSATLYLKLLMVDYSNQYAIIELFGEWNDCLYNDIKFLKDNVIDILVAYNINKFILIGDNVLNFHYSDDSYYEEWFDDVQDGWIACVNFRKHVISEFEKANIDFYLAFSEKLNHLYWRKTTPADLYTLVSNILMKRLNP